MPKPTRGTSAATEGLIRVFITPTMERELQRRNMFPELRLDKAECVNNGATGVYRVSRSRAAEILADAQAMRARADELPRGTPKAYSTLARNLIEALRAEARRGLWRLPDPDEMIRRCNESPARFDVGDECLYFRDQSAEYGYTVRIIKGFGLHKIRTEDGHFLDEKGERVEPLFGYLVQATDGERWFAAPHQLTGDDCKPSHIRLVAGLDVQQPQRHV
jgi:hypothetical protein